VWKPGFADDGFAEIHESAASSRSWPGVACLYSMAWIFGLRPLLDPSSQSPVLGADSQIPISHGRWRVSASKGNREVSSFNRRDVCMGFGSLCAALLSRHAPAGARVKPTRATDIPPAPVARVEVVKETYFGETLSDPYRWMENDKDPDWIPFLKGQDQHTRAMLATIPGRDQLLKRVQQLSGDSATTRSASRTGAMLFFEQRPVGADNFKPFVREQGIDRVLVDPTLVTFRRKNDVVGLASQAHTHDIRRSLTTASV
jgi:hypothetical protein